MNYRNKYEKYRNKYNLLLNQIGGSDKKDIIKQIDSIIEKYGIPFYVIKWKKMTKPVMPKKFKDHYEYVKFLNTYVQVYHNHSFIQSNTIMNKMMSHNKPNSKKYDPKPMPDFKWNDGIGTIKFYHFQMTSNKVIDERDTKKVINLVKKNYDKWQKSGLKGLIIDLTEHSGGNMWVCVKSLKDILGNTTLLAFDNVKVTKKDKKWINIIDGNVLYDQKFLTNELGIKIPIGIIVSGKTSSSGEIIASIFIGRKNTKIFGDKVNRTAGDLSVNDGFDINSDLKFWLTCALVTTVDEHYHLDEYISAEKSNDIMHDVNEWINLKN